MAGEAHRLVIGRAIAPDGAFRLLAAGLDRPVRAVALERAIGLVLGRTQQVHAHILLRQIKHRPVPSLLAAHRLAGVGDHGPGEGDAHPPSAGRGKADDPTPWFSLRLAYIWS